MADEKRTISFSVDVTPKKEDRRMCLCIWSILERCAVCDPDGRGHLPILDPKLNPKIIEVE